MSAAGVATSAAGEATNVGLGLIFILLVPLAIAGLALIHQGLGRSRSAAHAMLATLCAVSVAAILFVLIGSAWAGYEGGAAHTFWAFGRGWDWLGASSFLEVGLLKTGSDRPGPLLGVALQMFAMGLAALIPISAGTDRWRLGAICASSALLAGVFYPLFAHWVWGGGWLAQLPTMFGLPPLVDAGGTATVQVVGGLAALSVAWVLGPRKGKYAEGMATAIPGHNIVQVLFGCLLALVGWIGLECAASMIFYSEPPLLLINIAIDAMLSAAAGFLAALLITQLRYRKPDASLSANGWIAGLVAGSASCGMLSPLETVFVGLVAGGLVTFLVEALELKLLIDDPGGAISVHFGAGLWGMVAFGLFGPTSASRMALLLTELVGIATLLGVMLPAIHLGNLLLNRLIPFRVDRDGDWQGMDIRELGAGAYPEFVIHADEFVPR
jgi:Amt family ammonium transporter